MYNRPPEARLKRLSEPLTYTDFADTADVARDAVSRMLLRILLVAIFPRIRCLNSDLYDAGDYLDVVIRTACLNC